MADTLMQEAILHGDLIVSVDDTLAGYDARKLPAALRSALSAALADARGLNSALQLAAGDQAGARLRVKTGHERLSGLVRKAISTPSRTGRMAMRRWRSRRRSWMRW
jgi:hypothetical protein